MKLRRKAEPHSLLSRSGSGSMSLRGRLADGLPSPFALHRDLVHRIGTELVEFVHHRKQ